jgi:hypothetical protein
MSPFVSQVVPVYQRGTPSGREDMGRLTNLRPADLQRMLAADLFVDAGGEQLFTATAVQLDVALFEVLAHRPELVVPASSQDEAHRWLARYPEAIFAALNLTKYGAELLHRHEALITRILDALLSDPRVVVLNLFSTSYDFAHWPSPERERRRQLSLDESAWLARLAQRSARIVSCVDLPLPTVAALLTRCHYFVGVDNGIKHLAWALDVPHTFLHPCKPDVLQMVRWMPDLNRILLFDCQERSLARHLAAMEAALAASRLDGRVQQ